MPSILASLALPLLCGLVQGEQTQSFESAPAGPLSRWHSPQGEWSAAEGHAEIDPSHARSGLHCLHILGGHERRVELQLPDGLDAGELRFWAERWTRRDPFLCVVQGHDGQEWRELSDLSDQIAVGALNSLCSVLLPEETQRVAIVVSAPPDTGLLIDDLDVLAAAPLRLGNTCFVQPILPVLLGNRLNPVLRIELDVEGSRGSLALEQLQLDLSGSSAVQDWEVLEVFAGGSRTELPYRDPDEVFDDTDRFAEPLVLTASPIAGAEPESAALRPRFHGRHALVPGLNTFWVSLRPRPDADLDARVHVIAREFHLDDGSVFSPAPKGRLGQYREQRMGVALRKAGDDGSAAFRIPGLVTTPQGTLIAVYDVRWKGWGDLPGDIDVGMRRSTDGGRSWEPQRIILDMGDDPEFRHDGIGDPAVLVDRQTGRILVIATWSHGDRSWRGSGPGLSPEQTGQLMLTHSDDDGKTWSAPRNITAQVKDPQWCFLLQGPGRGISLSDGSLVFPAQFQLSPEQQRLPHSTILRSTDHGQTWSIGTGPQGDTTESAVVELQDGILMLNMRDNRGGARSVLTSADLGQSWEQHSTHRRALMEPVCMASLLHVGRELSGDADGVLLFSNPAVPRAPRRAMTLKASTDFGATWPAGHTLLLDEGASAGYSCLTMLDEHTVGILYEGSRAHMTFQRIPLTDLLGSD